jgi:hypothetical protein
MLIQGDRYGAASHVIQCVERLLPGFSTNTHAFSSFVLSQTGVRPRFLETSSEILPKSGV